VRALSIAEAVKGAVPIIPVMPVDKIGAVREQTSVRGMMDCSKHCNCGGRHCGDCGGPNVRS
jgi:flavoprotein